MKSDSPEIEIEQTNSPKEIKNRVIDLKEYERVGELESQKEKASFQVTAPDKDITHASASYQIGATNNNSNVHRQKQTNLSANSMSETIREKTRKIPGVSKIINKPKTSHQYHISNNSDSNYNTNESADKGLRIGFLERFFIVAYLIFLVGLIGFINLNSESNIFVIFISLSPTFMTVILAVMFFFTAKKNRFSLLIVPVLTSVVWYILASNSGVLVLQNVDAGNTTFLNFILSLLFIVILDLLSGLFKATNKVYKKKNYVDGYNTTVTSPDGYEKDSTSTKENKSLDVQETVTEKNIEEQEKSIEQYIQSIEDKSKAINFVIGRVYSKKHGGSPELRSMININKEWYNLFAEIPTKQLHKHLPDLRQTVFRIGEVLNLYQKSEKEIFGKLHKNLKNIERDESGNNTIIDVLINNDKDPVEVYYKTALEFCNKAITEIDQLSRRKQPVESNILGTSTQ